MKKLLVVLLAIFCATTVMVQAQDTNSAASSSASTGGKKKHLTAEQQKVMDEMLAKYDTNKDGKIDKTERAAMTQEDKDAMIAAGLMKTKKPKTDAGASTNAPAN
jgi:hypothetical protein